MRDEGEGEIVEVPPATPLTGPPGNATARFLRRLKGQTTETANSASAYVRQSTTSPATSSENVEIDDNLKVGVGIKQANVGLDQYYVPIDTYEGRHRYDPKARWTEAEEKRLVRKVLCNISSQSSMKLGSTKYEVWELLPRTNNNSAAIYRFDLAKMLIRITARFKNLRICLLAVFRFAA